MVLRFSKWTLTDLRSAACLLLSGCSLRPSLLILPIVLLPKILLPAEADEFSASRLWSAGVASPSTLDAWVLYVVATDAAADMTSALQLRIVKTPVVALSPLLVAGQKKRITDSVAARVDGEMASTHPVSEWQFDSVMLGDIALSNANNNTYRSTLIGSRESLDLAGVKSVAYSKLTNSNPELMPFSETSFLQTTVWLNQHSLRINATAECEVVATVNTSIDQTPSDPQDQQSNILPINFELIADQCPLMPLTENLDSVTSVGQRFELASGSIGDLLFTGGWAWLARVKTELDDKAASLALLGASIMDDSSAPVVTDYWLIALPQQRMLQLQVDRRRDGRGAPIVNARIYHPGQASRMGRVTKVDYRDVDLQNLTRFFSDSSGLQYGVGSTLNVSSDVITTQLTISPSFDDQEMGVIQQNLLAKDQSDMSRWRGLIHVAGSVDGMPFSGHGFADLSPL